MLIVRTIRGPVTASFQIAVRTILPSHSTSRGRPTLTDSRRPVIARWTAPRGRWRRTVAGGAGRHAAAAGEAPRARAGGRTWPSPGCRLRLVERRPLDRARGAPVIRDG